MQSSNGEIDMINSVKTFNRNRLKKNNIKISHLIQWNLHSKTTILENYKNIDCNIEREY